MWKKVLLIGLILSAFCVSSVLAVDGGNSRKGKHLYKKNCKSCHSAGAEAKDLTPMSKTMKQWDRFFEKAEHPGDVFKKTSEKDLKDINQFLFDKAADSPSPETCG